jgi:hypothetical protein
MKHLQYNWKSRAFIISIVSIIICILLVSLELTSWADQINQQGFSHGKGGKDKPDLPAILMYILPFFKELILIGVPLLLTLGLMKVPLLIKRKKAKK